MFRSPELLELKLAMDGVTGVISRMVGHDDKIILEESFFSDRDKLVSKMKLGSHAFSEEEKKIMEDEIQKIQNQIDEYEYKISDAPNMVQIDESFIKSYKAGEASGDFFARILYSQLSNPLIKSMSYSSNFYHVDALGQAIQSIQTIDVKLKSPDSEGLILVIHKNNQKEYYLVKEKEQAKELMGYLDAIPERYLEHIRETTSELMPATYWGRKGGGDDKDWDEDKEALAIYKESDKLIVNEILLLLKKSKEIPDPLTIFDVGGGKGRLANDLINEVSKRGVRLNYVIVEPDPGQCRIAEEKLQALKQKGISLEYKVIPATLEKFKRSDAFAQYRGLGSFVISSGGPLNAQVVEEKAARQNISFLHELCKPDEGMLVATGLSPLWLKKEDFSDHWHILLGAKRIESDRLKQFYVCRNATPSTLAAKYGRAEKIQQLIREGVDLSIPDGRGYTPAVLAAKNGHANVIKILLDAKVNLEKADAHGETCATMAARYGRAEIIQMLIDANINLNQPNAKGETPYRIAKEQGHHDIVERIQTAMQRELNDAIVKNNKEKIVRLIHQGAKLSDSSYQLIKSNKVIFINYFAIY